MTEQARPTHARRVRHTATPSQAPHAHLVLGHDHHPRSVVALTVAADLARRLQAQLHVVHGIDLSDYPIDPDAADWEQQARRALDAQHQQVAAALADCDTGWSYHAWRGDPVELLTAVAEETDALMIIVGSRGEGPGKVVDRILERSVSHGLIAHQHRPVLVVPHHG
ncbi:universal stress protein [Pseudonocardia kujensis]|uniref:universal stress protein n=1 Tax=Pseudonocardia kujensis TaxID=1128675 RepID=UPI001E64B54F|nr:universal stress protein [Pseudonocardia kujensis]MCE0764387.1 universal stress protein [Pseudonocardia kujensis]